VRRAALRVSRCASCVVFRSSSLEELPNAQHSLANENAIENGENGHESERSERCVFAYLRLYVFASLRLCVFASLRLCVLASRLSVVERCMRRDLEVPDRPTCARTRNKTSRLLSSFCVCFIFPTRCAFSSFLIPHASASASASASTSASLLTSHSCFDKLPTPSPLCPCSTAHE
jgi:hypothetical protein